MLYRRFSVFLCLFFVVLLTACAGSKKTDPAAFATDNRIADERNFPQDLQYYVKKVGASKRLLDAEQQLAQDRRFNEIFFGPWSMTHGATKKSDACIHKARGYKLGGLRWPQDEWNVIVANADMSSFPSRSQPAITIRNTDLRQMPTHEARYDKPILNERAYPFDDFQYSLFPVGTPLFVTHLSSDGRWYFVESPLVSGWVDANDVAPVDGTFIQTWRSRPLAALIKDNIHLPGVGTPGMIGTVLPIASQSGSSIQVYVPVRNEQGFAGMRTVSLSTSEAQAKPMPLTAGNVAKLGMCLLGQPYGWGGMYGLRDCSATTRDLLTPFGIWLPRNSRVQARSGVVVSLEGLSREEKERIIQQYGTPFLSLLGLPGHITMYVGTYDGKAAILHNVWGLRTVEGTNNNARHIIGKTLVTSIAPGLELPNLYRPVTFVDRLRAMATPGAR